MSSVEAKLAAFRQEKAEKEKKEQRKQRAWDWITLAPIRQRTAAAGGGHQEQQPQQQQQREEVPEQEELEEPTPWTPLDYAILAVKICLWLCFLALFLHLEIAAVFVCSTGFALIYLNLGTRHRSQPSAYSVFNPNCEAIDGTLTGEQFDREIRRGM